MVIFKLFSREYHMVRLPFLKEKIYVRVTDISRGVHLCASKGFAKGHRLL